MHTQLLTARRAGQGRESHESRDSDGGELDLVFLTVSWVAVAAGLWPGQQGGILGLLCSVTTLGLWCLTSCKSVSRVCLCELESWKCSCTGYPGLSARPAVWGSGCKKELELRQQRSWLPNGSK